MILHTISPLFAGEQPPEEEIWSRINAWEDFTDEDNETYRELKIACGEAVSITPYRPGKEIYIPSKKHKYPIKVIYPPSLKASVPKGFVVRLHLLYLLYQLDHANDAQAQTFDSANVVFACMDGSGAFDFSSLKLLVETFNNNPLVDVVLGRRPVENTGMIPGRKEIEEFEQYLLFLHRGIEIRESFSESACNFGTFLLPDGQAGCWGFRLSCAQRLPLTANGYEIEYDLLASALDAHLKIAYTPPLVMGKRGSSGVSSSAIEISMRKLDFIRRKLRISRGDIAQAWRDFSSRSECKEVARKILAGYSEALLQTFHSD